MFYSKNNLPFSRQNYSTLADCVACDYDEEDVALEFVAVALLIWSFFFNLEIFKIIQNLSKFDYLKPKTKKK